MREKPLETGTTLTLQGQGRYHRHGRGSRPPGRRVAVRRLAGALASLTGAAYDNHRLIEPVAIFCSLWRMTAIRTRPVLSPHSTS